MFPTPAAACSRPMLPTVNSNSVTATEVIVLDMGFGLYALSGLSYSIQKENSRA